MEARDDGFPTDDGLGAAAGCLNGLAIMFSIGLVIVVVLVIVGIL